MDLAPQSSSGSTPDKFSHSLQSRGYLFFHEGRRDRDTGKKIMAYQHNTTRADLKAAFERGPKNGGIDKERYEDLKDDLAEYNEELLRRLQNEGIDNLTTLPTIVESKLGKLIEVLKKPHMAAVLLINIDLNHLKEINDTYGHPTGDVALQAFAQRLKTGIKEITDFAFRPHGDEFIVMLVIEKIREKDGSYTDIPDEALKTIFEEWKKRINANISIKVDAKGTVFPFSASMGCEILREGESRTSTEVLAAADRKMYLNKYQGKGKKWLADLTESEEGLKGAKVSLNERATSFDVLEYKIELADGSSFVINLSRKNKEVNEIVFAGKIKALLEEKTAA